MENSQPLAGGLDHLPREAPTKFCAGKIPRSNLKQQTMDQKLRGEQLLPETILCLDQTQLVTALIKVDDYAEEDLRAAVEELDKLSRPNSYGYTLIENGEVAFITEKRYFAQMHEWQERERLLHEDLWTSSLSFTESAVKYKEQTELRAKIGLYDAANCIERQVYSWWLVPYWLGDCLVAKEETILRAYGCTWWGITDLAIVHPRTSPVLMEIITECLSGHPKTLHHEATSA